MKKTIITSISLALCGGLSLLTLYGYFTELNDISFPIGFGIIALVLAFMLYLFVKNKELPLSRLGLKRTLKICRDEQKSYLSKRKSLEKFLNSRYILLYKVCPICYKTGFRSLDDKPCIRCKTLFIRGEDSFSLESKGISNHRLASLYTQDFKELSALITQYNPATNVPSSGGNDGDSININITITHN
jgi:hypothetical protein